jgi:cysteine-rich secretory family protein
MDRIESTGYMHGARTWTVGENLVWGTGPLSTPQALVTAWMNSPPHRENLLRPSFREMGLAAVTGTPMSRSDGTGVTVSSEYGYRTFAAKKQKHKGKARKASRKKQRRR